MCCLWSSFGCCLTVSNYILAQKTALRFGRPVAVGMALRRPRNSAHSVSHAGVRIPIVPIEKSQIPPTGGLNPDSGIQRRANICSGARRERDQPAKREGLSILAISNLKGYDRKTIRKCLLAPVARPSVDRGRAPSEQGGGRRLRFLDADLILEVSIPYAPCRVAFRIR